MATELTRDQSDALLAKLRPTLLYLNRLVDRMDKAGFAPDGDLRSFTARDAMHRLTVEIHYVSCRGSAGRG